MGLFSDILHKLPSQSSQSSQTVLSNASLPSVSELDIYRNRQMFATNLGGWFLWEKHMNGPLFPPGTEAELDVARKVKSADHFQHVWDDFITEADFSWLQQHEVTGVRIPFGYWIVEKAKFVSGTDFAGLEHVYSGAWDRLIRAIGWAAQHRIGVVLDLHAVPGGANPHDHSGKSDNVTKFWDSKKLRQIAVDVVKAVAQESLRHPNIAGIQVLNEPSVLDSRAEEFYVSAAKAVHAINPNLPVYISDGYWLDKWCDWVAGRPDDGFVIDTHIYRAHTAEDAAKSYEQHMDELPGTVIANGKYQEVDIYVGEYCCVMPEDTWRRSGLEGQARQKAEAEFGNKQLQLFKERAKVGSAFWTYKHYNHSGGGFGFRHMLENGMTAPQMKVKQVPDSAAMEAARNDALGAHKGYWESQGVSVDEQQYRHGFEVAWKDAVAFAGFDGSLIGRQNSWRRLRLSQVQGRSKKGEWWQWEHGFKEGLKRFEEKAM